MPKMSPMRRKEALTGYLYLSPFILGFIIFQAGPMLASLGLSFTQYRITSAPKFLGIENYRTALFDDALFWPALGKTFYYTLVGVPMVVIGSLVVALMLNQKVKGSTAFRTAFFLPHLTPVVATALLWTIVLDADYGVLNYLLSLAGIEGPGWLTRPAWAIPSLLIVSLWMGVGGNRMLIFLAGLQGVPQALYDAAVIDGANSWQRFWNITLPMLSPTIFFNSVIAIIQHLRVFTIAMVATKGGPARATWFYALHIYTQAFEYFEMGYGSALAWLFFLVMLAFTYIQFRSASHWVYYEGEVRS